MTLDEIEARYNETLWAPSSHVVRDIAALIAMVRERDKLIEELQDEAEKQILALSDKEVIALHVAAYESAEKALEATDQIKHQISASIIRSYQRENQKLRKALQSIANINDGPDRASGEWRCTEAAAIAVEAIKEPGGDPPRRGEETP